MYEYNQVMVFYVSRGIMYEYNQVMVFYVSRGIMYEYNQVMVFYVSRGIFHLGGASTSSYTSIFLKSRWVKITEEDPHYVWKIADFISRVIEPD